MNNKPHVFLGGTCGNSTWRDELIPKLEASGISFFNPQLPPGAWNEEAEKIEDFQKTNCSFMLYYLCSPKEEGNPVSVYSVCEASIAACTDPMRTLIVVDTTGMEGHALKAMNKVKKDLGGRAMVFGGQEDLIFFLDAMIAINS